MAVNLGHKSFCSIELEPVFHSLDKDGDGKISAAELTLCMLYIGEEFLLDEAESLVASVDSDGDGLLDFTEFMKLVKASDEEEEEERRKGLWTAFEMFGDEGEGCITAESLKRMLGKLGTSRDVDDCRTMIRRFDLNGDGVLSFEEFQTMMQAA